LVDATWWYDAKEIDGTLILKGEKSINARNLYKNSWREAINVRRGIAIVTGLGEGKKIDGKDKKFLVTADRLLLVGALYQKFPSGRYTCVIITRDEHPRFTPYH
jgi:putative SOS response-associated peptidase YedK